MSNYASTVPTNLDNTIGAALLGSSFACILYGMTSLQVYLYFHHYRNDTLLHKVVVGVLWCLDTIHMSLVIHVVYVYLVTGFGKRENLLVIDWSIKGHVLVNVIVVLLVQSMYALRVWKLGGYHHGVLGYVVAGVVLSGFVIGVLLAYEVFTATSFASLKSISWVFDASFGSATVIDFILSAAMCFYLSKSKGHETQLNSKISKLMQYCLSSGLFTSAFSLCTLFTYSVMPDNLVFLAFGFLLEKLYVASFLAMLNARERTPSTSVYTSQTALESHGVPSLTVRTPTSQAALVSPSSPYQYPPSPMDSEKALSRTSSNGSSNVKAIPPPLQLHYNQHPTHAKSAYSNGW